MDLEFVLDKLKGRKGGVQGGVQDRQWGFKQMKKSLKQ